MGGARIPFRRAAVRGKGRKQALRDRGMGAKSALVVSE